MLSLVVFKKELEKDVAGDTSGNFAKLLLALVQVSLVTLVCMIHITIAAQSKLTWVICFLLFFFYADQESGTILCCRLWKDWWRCQSKLPIFSTLWQLTLRNCHFYIIFNVCLCICSKCIKLLLNIFHYNPSKIVELYLFSRLKLLWIFVWYLI